MCIFGYRDVVTQVYVKKIADTITSTAKRKHFKFSLCTTKLLQDIPVKERCNMRQYPQG